MGLPAARLDPSAVRSEYRILYKDLRDRFAQTVVLTFDQIEDLLGSSLPEAARFQPTWWTDANADGTASPQSHAWIQAERTAVPNLRAHIVTFERVSG